MLVDIKNYYEKEDYENKDEIYRNVLACIVSSSEFCYDLGHDDVSLEWRFTMPDAASMEGCKKALEEELFCLELSDWCLEHGMLFKSDVGKIEQVGSQEVRGFDHKLLMPGMEYLRIISSSESQPIVARK